jgi:hypothetical protein
LIFARNFVLARKTSNEQLGGELIVFGVVKEREKQVKNN